MLEAYTLCLDAMPFLPEQVAMFESLDSDWRLHLIEGVADNVNDTDWCSKLPPRLSRDGTSEYINTLLDHPNIKIHRRQFWHGKTAMVNAALATIREDCVLLQIDCDEMWRADQVEKIVELFKTTDCDSMRFFCRFFLGPNIVATGQNCWSNRAGEWHRAWRYKVGQMATRHEPPVLQGCGQNCMTREATREHGLVFDHYAYYFRHQCAFKERYYRYPNLVSQWQRLQDNKTWPVKRLADFLPFVGEGVGADILK